MPMWLLCSCLNTLGCSCINIVIHLPFIATLSIITSLSLNIQYGDISCFDMCCLMTSLLLHMFSNLVCMLYSVASSMSLIVLHTGMSVNASIAFMLDCRIAISSSLFSAWFCHESQLVSDVQIWPWFV